MSEDYKTPEELAAEQQASLNPSETAGEADAAAEKDAMDASSMDAPDYEAPAKPTDYSDVHPSERPVAHRPTPAHPHKHPRT